MKQADLAGQIAHRFQFWFGWSRFAEYGLQHVEHWERIASRGDRPSHLLESSLPLVAAKFWPIYRDYDVELNKLNDLRVANIKEYARTYTEMTDAKADELIKDAMTFQKQRDELLGKYYERVKQELGAI